MKEVSTPLMGKEGKERDSEGFFIINERGSSKLGLGD